MSHLLLSVDGVGANVDGSISFGLAESAYHYRVNGAYNSGSFSYAGPLNAPFYNGTSSSVYTQVNEGGFAGLLDSSELVVLRSGTSALYWWDQITIPAGQWLIRGTYAGSDAGTEEGYLQWQTSTGTALGPRATYSASSAGGALAIAVVDTASPVTIRLRFVGTGAFYRAVGSSHLLCGIHICAF